MGEGAASPGHGLCVGQGALLLLEQGSEGRIMPLPSPAPRQIRVPGDMATSPPSDWALWAGLPTLTGSTLHTAGTAAHGASEPGCSEGQGWG